MKQVPVELGQLWSDEGGHYIGNILYPNGDIYALIVADKSTEYQSVFSRSGCYDGNGDLYDGYQNSMTNCEIFDRLKAIQSGGKNDWYIPARAELNICWENNNHLPENQCFNDEWYWSSSWGSSHLTWHQNFYSGDQGYDVQTYSYRVRAVRRVKLN